MRLFASILEEVTKEMKGIHKMNFVDYRIDPMKKDILTLIDKVEDLEQMIFNCNAKRKDEYKLINDRINELLERILAIEREIKE